MSKALLLIIGLLLLNKVNAQDTLSTSTGKEKMMVFKTTRKKFVGTLLSDDGREMKINDKKFGIVFIPKSDLIDVYPYNPEVETLNDNVVKIKTEDLYSHGFMQNHGGIKRGTLAYNSMYFVGGYDIAYGFSDRLSFSYVSTIAFTPTLVNMSLNVPLTKKIILGTKLYTGKISLYNRFTKDLLAGAIGGLTYNGEDFSLSANGGLFNYSFNHKYYSYETVYNGGYYAYQTSVSHTKRLNTNYGFANVSIFYRATNHTGLSLEATYMQGGNTSTELDYFVLITPSLKIITKKAASFNFGVNGFLVNDDFKMFPYIGFTKKINFKALDTL